MNNNFRPYDHNDEIKKVEIVDTDTRSKRFGALLTVFAVGTLSFAIALSYNTFIQNLIQYYSDDDYGVYASFVNLILFTLITLGILYSLWSFNPNIVKDTLI